MRWLLRAVALALTAAAVAACGSNSDSGSGGPAPSGNSPEITIKGFGYGAPLTVAPGATVTVRQEDSVQHDVSSAAFKTPLLSRGKTATFTAPAQPGTYDYTCSVHPQMHGRLIVQAGGGSGDNSPSDSASPGSSDTGYGPGGY